MFEVSSEITGRRLACKIQCRDKFDEIYVKNEISIHRDMIHKNIVEWIHDFHDHKYSYLILEFCENSLEDILQSQQSPLETDQCRTICEQILRGVEFIHSKRIIHRDLKPSNVLLDEKMTVKLCDFGLAVGVNHVTKAICGTTNFMAPEVVSGKCYVYKSDIWSVAVIAFIAFFGYKPFDENDTHNVENIYNRIENVDYRFLFENCLVFLHSKNRFFFSEYHLIRMKNSNFF